MGFLNKKDPITDLQRLIGKNENDTRSHLELAALLAKKGDRTGAVDHYVRAAKAFVADKHVHKASAAAKQALVVDPKNVEAHEFLARLYEDGNLKEDARAILKKLIDLYFNAGEQPLVMSTRERLNKLGPGR